jgi:hypothetical protein
MKQGAFQKRTAQGASTAMHTMGPQVIDTPGYHGCFMVGTNVLYLCHMPMFTMENHMYEVILRASLPADVMQSYQNDKKANPSTAYNLINVEENPFTLPQVQNGEVTSFIADIYKGYSNDDGGTPGPLFAGKVPVEIQRVVYFRHFDYDFQYPTHLTYLLFGSDGEVHMTNYISRDHDFQHVLTLASVPDWLSPTQLEAVVQVNFVDISGTPVPCTNPLMQPTYNVHFQGWPDMQFTLNLTGAQSLWFSTGNALNAKDPCQNK